MLTTLIRSAAFALLALFITQVEAFNFTLEITGKISNPNNAENNSRIFTDQELLAMPVHSITTSTSWTPRAKFDGVLLADVLNRAGAEGTMMTLYALNDYYIDVPISDVAKYNMILAYKMDGNRLQVRDFGPLFLIYPRDSGGAELDSPLYGSRFIWQINRILIK